MNRRSLLAGLALACFPWQVQLAEYERFRQVGDAAGVKRQ